MQLSDVLENTGAVNDIIKEMKFNEYLERLSKLPPWKKKELEEDIYSRDFGLKDLVQIFDTTR